MRGGPDDAITVPPAHPPPLRRGVGGEVARSVYLRDDRTVAAARELRSAPTRAEKLLWTRLRRDQRGIRFRPQHPIGRRIVDFYAPEIRLAVEVDGGQHAVEVARDVDWSRELSAHGVAVLRFWNNEVMDNMDGVLEAIGVAIEHLRAHTSPLTPLRGGGGDAGGDLSALNLRFSLPGSPA